jgi:hypothetical protein
VGTPNFDYRDLAVHLTQNGNQAMPPVDVQRMGTIAGFDPLFDDGDGGTYPAVSVYLAGADVATPGCRFASSYTPHLDEMVICTQTGNDVYVSGSLTGTIKATTQTQLGGTISVVAHQTFSIGTVAKPVIIEGVNSAKGSQGYFTINNTQLVAPILPNRLYKAEVTATYTVAGAKSGSVISGSTVSLGVFTPVQGFMPVGGGSVQSNGTATINGSVIASDVSSTKLVPGQWSAKYPDNKFTWYLGAQTNASPTTMMFQSLNNIQLTIYDMGTTP